MVEPMIIVTELALPPIYLRTQDIQRLISLKNVSDILRDFRNFCEKHPSYFGKTVPVRKFDGNDTRYNLYAFGHYWLNKPYLDAGNRTIKYNLEALEKVKWSFGIVGNEKEHVL